MCIQNLQLKIATLSISPPVYKLAVLLLFCLTFNIIYANEPSIPIVWHVPPANDYFIGREKELLELDKMLSKHHKVIIVGAGGVGKTQLAKKYVHAYEQKYKVIWWFDMAKNMDDQLSTFAYQLSKHNIGNIKADIDKISS